MSVAEPGSHAAIQDLKGEESARVALDSNLPNTESIAYPSARQESPLHVRSYRELPPEERTGEPLSGNHALEQEAYNPSPKESIGEDIKSLTGKEVTTSDTTSEGDVLDWEKLNQIEDFKDEPIPSGSAEMKTVAVTKLPDPIEKLQAGVSAD
ncbi:hypothetical protein N7504_002951 [Penicillium tannophilum]|nr:hypothetical protein N7504_002951 [Penicillium tannophilum]